jgi:hypothetical protein
MSEKGSEPDVEPARLNVREVPTADLDACQSPREDQDSTLSLPSISTWAVRPLV